jgi:hypothetical protein
LARGNPTGLDSESETEAITLVDGDGVSILASPLMSAARFTGQVGDDIGLDDG